MGQSDPWQNQGYLEKYCHLSNFWWLLHCIVNGIHIYLYRLILWIMRYNVGIKSTRNQWNVMLRISIFQKRIRWLTHDVALSTQHDISQLFTQCGLVTLYGGINMCQHWSCNGLLPNDTKPFPEPCNANLSPMRYFGIHMMAISLEMLKISKLDMILKHTNNSELQPHVSGCTKLKYEKLKTPGNAAAQTCNPSQSERLVYKHRSSYRPIGPSHRQHSVSGVF